MLRFRTIKATVFKEWILMLRDIGGLSVLLLMPAVLILIMALVQDAPFRDYQDLHLEVLVADEDGGALSAAIHEAFQKSKAFTLIDSLNGKPLTADRLKESLHHGKHSIGLVIPRGATAEIINAANTVANSLAAQLGTGTLPQRPPRDSLSIRLMFDPVSRPAFRMAVHAALDKAVSGASTKLLLTRITKLAGNVATEDSASQEKVQNVLAGLRIREEQTNTNEEVPKHINSVQHNVPAWAIFGMFFIVVPLSAHIIREREQGSTLRVRLMPGAATSVAIGRIIANTLVCCLQFAVMCAVGRWILPMAGLASLQFGAHPAALIPLVFATAFCATSYGNFVASLFKTGAQAVPFGAISIVILSALGGIWVPVELLPPVLQATARISPLHWALQGAQAVLLRDGGWAEIATPTLALCGLAFALWLLAIWQERRTGAGL